MSSVCFAYPVYVLRMIRIIMSNVYSIRSHTCTLFNIEKCQKTIGLCVQHNVHRCLQAYIERTLPIPNADAIRCSVTAL